MDYLFRISHLANYYIYLNWNRKEKKSRQNNALSEEGRIEEAVVAYFF